MADSASAKNVKGHPNGVTKDGLDNIGTASQAFSKILENVGDSGKWQTRFMIFSGSCGIFTSLHNVGAVFLGATPKHWCDIPSLNLSKSEAEEVQNITVPWIRGKDGDLVHSSCDYYDYNYTNVIDVDDTTLMKGGKFPMDELPCTSWFYDTSVHSSTVVSEWDLVCSERWLMSTIQASYMMGILTGAVLFSAISDRIGRKKSAMICVGLFLVSSILAAFSVSFLMFLVLRFITAGSGQGLFLINFVILMECSGKKARSIHGSLYHIFFGIGFSTLPLLAYIWRDWRSLQLACSIPICILLVYFWILPESPRWLLLHKRFDEGISILREIADFNGKSLPPQDELNCYLDVILKEIAKEPPTSISQKISRSFHDVGTLVRTPNMRRRNLVIFYAWFVVSMLYYGLTFSSANINASIFVTVLLAGIVEIPACLIYAFIALKCGRRLSLAITLIACGIACIAVVFVPKEMVWLNLLLSTSGKTLITGAFLLVFIYSAELVPTEVRNTSLGIASMFARIGSALAPYIVDLLGDVYYAIPFIIFGVLTLLSGILSVLLPETGKKDLPESVIEIEKQKK